MNQIRFETPDGTSITDIDTQVVDRIAATTGLPGEIVRLRGEDKPFVDEADAEERFEARKPLAGKDLRIESTVVVIDSARGTTRVLHTFEGQEGTHSGAAFVDARPLEYLYGVAMTIDEDLWFVPLDMNATEDPKLVPDTPPFRLAAIERCARYQLLGGYHYGEPDDVAAADFATIRGEMREPASGEFHVVTEANGDRKLFAAPWTSSCSEVEIRLATEALAALNGGPTPRA